MIFCLVSAVVIDKWGSKTGMVCGYVLVGLGCMITSFVSHFVTVILALMVVWMGFGFFEVGDNVIATLLFTEHSAVYLNLMHFFYGLSAITGPQIASGFVNWLNDGYQGVYKGLSVIVVVLFVILIFTPFSTLTKVNTPTDSERVVEAFALSLRDPMCGCVNHTRFYGGDRIRRFKLGSLVLPRCVRLRCDEGRCVVRIDVLHSLHRLSIAQWLPDREDRLLCLSLLFAGDRDRHLRRWLPLRSAWTLGHSLHGLVHRNHVPHLHESADADLRS